jgi:hypothetical protein
MAKKTGVDHNFSHSTLLSRDHWIDGWMDGCPCVLMANKRCLSQFFTLDIIVYGPLDGWVDGCPCVLIGALGV